MKIEICKVCYTFYEKDDEAPKWVIYRCPACNQGDQKRELTETDIDRFLDISFGSKESWKAHSVVIDGIQHTYFELNDLNERKKEMKMMLMYLLENKE